MIGTNGSTATPDSTPKKRGRPAGSKNKKTTKDTTSIPFTFASSMVPLTPAPATTNLDKYLAYKEILRDFFSLPEDVQASLKVLIKWEEEVKEEASDNLNDFFEG